MVYLLKYWVVPVLLHDLKVEKGQQVIIIIIIIIQRLFTKLKKLLFKNIFENYLQKF